MAFTKEVLKVVGQGGLLSGPWKKVGYGWAMEVKYGLESCHFMAQKLGYEYSTTIMAPNYPLLGGHSLGYGII